MKKSIIRKCIYKFKNSKNSRLYTAAIIVFLCLFILIPIPKLARRIFSPSSQSDYPQLKAIEYDSFASMGDFSFGTISSCSNLIAEVQIGKVYEPETVTYTPPEGSSDADIFKKQGISSISVQKMRIDLEIKHIIRGSEERRFVSLYMPADDDILPQLPKFKTGDRVVMFLLNYYTLNAYRPASTGYGFFYLADDDRIYPARLTRDVDEFSGMDYSEFKSRINSYDYTPIQYPEDE